MSHTVGERSAQDGPSGFGWIQPHSLVRRTPKTTRPSPSADSTVPTRSSLRALLDRGVRDTAREQQDRRDDDTSPAKTQRQEEYVVQNPPISGPSATAIGAGRRDQPVRARPCAGRKFLATRATMAGMISAAPMPSRNDQPKMSTVRFGEIDVVNEPHAIDHAADREGALAADDRADLARR